MSNTEKLICGDCKGITEFRKGLRGSVIVSFFLWAIFPSVAPYMLFSDDLSVLLWASIISTIPAVVYSIWRRKSQKKLCQYCDSTFLLPADSPYVADLIRPITKK